MSTAFPTSAFSFLNFFRPSPSGALVKLADATSSAGAHPHVVRHELPVRRLVRKDRKTEHRPCGSNALRDAVLQEPARGLVEQHLPLLAGAAQRQHCLASSACLRKLLGLRRPLLLCFQRVPQEPDFGAQHAVADLLQVSLAPPRVRIWVSVEVAYGTYRQFYATKDYDSLLSTSVGFSCSYCSFLELDNNGEPG